MIVVALEQRGPCLSTELADFLVKVHGLKPATARQRISRAPASVKRLAHLPFARKARFLYLEKDYCSPWFWQALKTAIYESGGAYARALGAVEARTIVPIAHFRIACGAPLAQKKHIFADTVLQRMVDASVLSIVDVAGIGQCIVTRELAESPQRLDDEIATTRARLISEQVLLDTVREWVKNMALASWGKVECRHDGPNGTIPKVGTFAWDMTGPSYLSALATWDKQKKRVPGFLVCDVLLNRNLSERGLSAFLHKCATLQQLRKVRATLSIFIAEHYSKEAFSAARSAGIIPATPASLFGQEVAEGFKQLACVLKDAAGGVIDPTRFDELFGRLGKLEGAIGNMRGAFFELLVADVIRRTSPHGTVALNKICRGDDNTTAEVDVWIIVPNLEARFIECKGRQPDSLVDDDEIGDWLTKRIPCVRQHLKRTLDSTPTKPVFELWVTGRLSAHALNRIDKTRQANQAKFELIVRHPEDIRGLVRAVNDPGLLKTFEQHFLPLAHDTAQKESIEATA